VNKTRATSNEALSAASSASNFVGLLKKKKEKTRKNVGLNEHLVLKAVLLLIDFPFFGCVVI